MMLKPLSKEACSKNSELFGNLGISSHNCPLAKNCLTVFAPASICRINTPNALLHRNLQQRPTYSIPPIISLHINGRRLMENSSSKPVGRVFSTLSIFMEYFRFSTIFYISTNTKYLIYTYISSKKQTIPNYHLPADFSKSQAIHGHQPIRQPKALIPQQISLDAIPRHGNHLGKHQLFSRSPGSSLAPFKQEFTPPKTTQNTKQKNI